jgi:hypothetical protein
LRRRDFFLSPGTRCRSWRERQGALGNIFSDLSVRNLTKWALLDSYYQKNRTRRILMTDNKPHQATTANQPKRQEQDHGSSQTREHKPGDKGRDQVGKDTDNDGRPVQPGHKPGEVDGDKQKRR